MGITYYDSNPVPVEYKEQEMREKVLSFISVDRNEFTFKTLSNYIVLTAIKEYKVKNVAQEKNGIFGGRLAEYKYYDMAPIFEKVLGMGI